MMLVLQNFELRFAESAPAIESKKEEGGVECDEGRIFTHDC